MGAWQEANFRVLFIGQAVSSLGNSLVPVALAFAVLDLTGSASDLGLVLGTQAAANVVFLLAGGVIADRMSRRALMLVADLVRGSSQLTLGLLLATGHPSVVVIAAIGAVIGMAGALFTPAASGLLPLLVGKDHLQQANALQQTASSVVGIAGPAIAGACVLTVGPGWAIILDAVTFFVNVAMLLRIKFNQVPRANRRRWFQDLRQGWTEVRSRHWLRNLIIGSAVFNVLFAVYSVLGPDVSRQSYHGAATWTAAAIAAAVASVLIGLTASKIKSRHPLRLAVPASGLFFLAPLAFGLLLPIPVVVLAAAAGGGGLQLFGILWETTFQRQVPEEMLSRIASFSWFGALIAYPAGLAIAGPLAATVGARTVLVIVGCVVAVETVLLVAAPGIRNLGEGTLPESSASQ